MKRKLIEIALPLEAINEAAAKEKSRKVGKPQQIHHWWARRPITAARAFLFAQLVDDPASNRTRFPTEENVRVERERLHGIVARLACWDAMNDKTLLEEANREILRSAGGSPPAIVDPFAGGGAIPLEAQRLGLETYASDINPVAVLINKALIEIPPKFLGSQPVFPGSKDSELHAAKGMHGLAIDVRAYGLWMKDEANRRIGARYPRLEGGLEPVAWIWARTVTCPNPACGVEMPLVRSWALAKKKGREAVVVPHVTSSAGEMSGLRIEFEVVTKTAPGAVDGTVGRQGAVCVACSAAVPLQYVRAEASRGQMGQRLLAIVADGGRGRVYLSPDLAHEAAADIAAPADVPDAPLPEQALGFRVQAYGLRSWKELFTKRQLLALAVFSDLVWEARERVVTDGGSPEYADAVATYLGLAVSRLSDWNGSLCRWESSAQVSQQVFGKQTISMTWDFAEAFPLGAKATGSFSACLTTMLRSLEQLGRAVAPASVEQADAANRDLTNLVINTDPPYYDNIGYADLSDYFYIWLRRSIRQAYPSLFGTVLAPKAEELVANPFRHGGVEGAKNYFEGTFYQVFARARDIASADWPIVVYYAFKQSTVDSDGEASTGWETLLDGMLRAGWMVTATWPVRSEMGSRMRGQGSNALASSIVLALRPRSANAPTTDRRGLISALQMELPEALRRLQQGAIAPVDLPQATIGPGMAVFSRYARVLEPDGSPMTVRSALSRINEILDQVLSEQEGDFDATSRFAIAWYRQHGYGTGRFGDADNLARARNTSVDSMDRDEILTSRAGKVGLIKPADTPVDYDVLVDEHTSAWEALHHTIRILESEGVLAAGEFLAKAQTRPDQAVDLDLVKELSFLLFSIAEKNGWTKDAISFNAAAQSWSDVVEASKTAPALGVQTELDYSEEET